MLNDNIIDCFLEDSSNKIESKSTDLNIKYTEIVGFTTIIKPEMLTQLDAKLTLTVSLEKLNKNKIREYNLNYNGYRTIRNVKPTKINTNCKNRRFSITKTINDNTRARKNKRNYIFKY